MTLLEPRIDVPHGAVSRRASRLVCIAVMATAPTEVASGSTVVNRWWRHAATGTRPT